MLRPSPAGAVVGLIVFVNPTLDVALFALDTTAAPLDGVR